MARHRLPGGRGGRVSLPAGLVWSFDDKDAVFAEVRRTLGPQAPPFAPVRDVLHDRRYLQNASRMQEQLRALPGPAHAVGLLEQVAIRAEQTGIPP